MEKSEQSASVISWFITWKNYSKQQLSSRWLIRLNIIRDIYRQIRLSFVSSMTFWSKHGARWEEAAFWKIPCWWSSQKNTTHRQELSVCNSHYSKVSLFSPSQQVKN